MGMKYLDTKKDSLEEAVSKAMNGDNRPSADTLVAEGGNFANQYNESETLVRFEVRQTKVG